MNSYLSPVNFLPPERIYRLPPSYDWQVIKDPTGLFIDAHFREIDVKNHTWDNMTDCWEEGTRFRNIKTGEVREVRNRLIIKINEV